MANHNYQNIKILFSEFSDIKDYNKRLQFFDTHFGLIPFQFPMFKTGVEMLMMGEGIDQLVKIFEDERKSSVSLCHEIMVDNEKFIFSIKPTNYNRQLLNDYIIKQFIIIDIGFADTIKLINNPTPESSFSIDVVRKEAQELILLIGQKLNHQVERSFRNQFLNVFYNGFTDYKSKFIKRFPTKKKFIELYLYAQGILFAKYVEALDSKFLLESHHQKYNNVVNPLKREFNLEKKMGLLFKNGIVEYLYTKAFTDEKLTSFFVKLFECDKIMVEKVLYGIRQKKDANLSSPNKKLII